MSKIVQIGATAAAAVAFVVMLLAAGTSSHTRWGTFLSLLAFVVLVSLAGYIVALKTYEVDVEVEADDGGAPEAGASE